MMKMAFKCSKPYESCTEEENANDWRVVMGKLKRFCIGEVT